jgi:hypothetical protein
LVAIALTGFIILAISVFSTVVISGSNWRKLLTTDIGWVFLLILPGVFLGLAIGEAHHHGWREFWEIIKPAKSRTFIKIILVVVGAEILALLFWALFNSKIPEVSLFKRFIYVAGREPGGVFAVFTGLATLIALGLTTHSLMEKQRTIVSFSDLIYRLCLMLESASFDDPFRMVCYTPALGCLALPDKDYEMFYNRLTNKTGNETKPRAEIVCLGPEELKEWHGRFKGRWTLRKLRGNLKSHFVDDDLLEEARKSSEDIIHHLKLGDGGDSRVKFLPHQFMPGFYFFFIDTRAIVVAPFFLQNPKGVPRVIERDASSVAMIGFETTDMGIVGTLQKMYERYKSFPSKLVGESSELIKASEIEEINLQIARIDGNGANSSLNKLKRMLRQLGTQFRQSAEQDYRQQFQNQSQDAELNLRLLYVDKEQ